MAEENTDPELHHLGQVAPSSLSRQAQPPKAGPAAGMAAVAAVEHAAIGPHDACPAPPPEGAAQLPDKEPAEQQAVDGVPLTSLEEADTHHMAAAAAAAAEQHQQEQLAAAAAQLAAGQAYAQQAAEVDYSQYYGAASDGESEEADPNAITGLFIPGTEGEEGGAPEVCHGRWGRAGHCRRRTPAAMPGNAGCKLGMRGCEGRRSATGCGTNHLPTPRPMWLFPCKQRHHSS